MPVLAIKGEASKLAYYQAEKGIGVLAPRDWHCFGTYGSGGDTLYVTPQPINSAKDTLRRPRHFRRTWD